MPLSANGVKEVFSIDPAGGGDVVVRPLAHVSHPILLTFTLC